MNKDEIRKSFDRCEATGDFAEKFYEIFLNRSPEISELFKNTDFTKQRKLLRGSVYALVVQDVEQEKTQKMLSRVGGTHCRSALNIRPELYEVWLDSLCETIKALDSEWTVELDEAWRKSMRPGIELITSKY